MVLRIHGKDESVVRFRQGAPSKENKGFAPSAALFCSFKKTGYVIMLLRYYEKIN